MSNSSNQSATQSLAAQRAAALGSKKRVSLAQTLRLRVWVPTFVVFLIVAALWQLVSIANPYILPGLDDIGRHLAKSPGMYWSNMLITAQEVAVGAIAGVVIAFIIAVIMAEFEIVERAVMPLVVVVMVTPIVAIAPALVVAFGFGMTPKYIVTGLMVFFPMLMNTIAGLTSVDKRVLDVMKTIHASRLEVLLHLRIPGSMPYFFAGLRFSLPLAIVGAAVAEFVAAGQAAGLGSLVTVSAAQANLPVTWAAIVLLAVMGVIIIGILALIRKRVLWWFDGDVVAKG